MPSLKQKTLVLTEPVEFAGTIYKQLVFHRLKAKHLLGIQQDKADPIEQSYALAAASAEVDIGVIYELDLDDVFKMQEILNDFFPPALVGKLPPTPAASQPT